MTSAARFVVRPGEAGERLDVVLAARLDESRSQAAARIERGDVRVDGAVASKSHRLSEDESVEVAPEPEEPTGAAGVAAPPIRYEDEHVLVVAKPAGMVVHPGAGHPAGTLVQTLAAAGVELSAAADEHRPGIVHRLDRGTSGLLVVAKTDRAYEGLVAALKRRDVERRYLALVEGRLPAQVGRVEAPIGRDPAERTRFAAVAGGKPAVTHWEVRAAGRTPEHREGVAVSLVVCTLETGRTHQIRVHLSYAGHPVVGDRRYGARRDVADRLRIERPSLHAGWLGFDHPVTERRVRVAEPPPDDLRAAATRAGLPEELVTAPLGEVGESPRGQVD